MKIAAGVAAAALMAGLGVAPAADRTADLARVAETATCLRSLEGLYAVRGAAPACNVGGTSGKGMADVPGLGIPASASIQLRQDDTEAATAWHGCPEGTAFLPGELVQVSVKEFPKAPEPTPPVVQVASAFKHSVRRGRGAFEHQTAEGYLLEFQAAKENALGVSCDQFKAAFGKRFEKATQTAEEWGKAHGVAGGVIVPSVREGMKPEEVEAILGAPERTAEVGGKSLYFYPKMKVTFTAGKVSAIE